MPNRLLFALHRWVAALAFLQLAAWTVSGLFFAVVPIERVRGASVKGAHQKPLTLTAAQVLPPSDILERIAKQGLQDVVSLELRASPSGLFYVGRGSAKGVRLDARSGEVAAVNQAEAEEIARRDQPNRPVVLSSELLTKDAGIEYRGRPLPAWRIVVDDGAGMAVYIDAATGEVTARRNNFWRAYDFLWSLHIMDYRERESFNHPLLIIAAVVGLMTVVSGAVLWGLRIVRRVRRWRTSA